MRSLNEICRDHPEHEQTARAALARAHELNDKITELERFPNDTWTYKSEVKAARAEYDAFYKEGILESSNPIIQELRAQ